LADLEHACLRAWMLGEAVGDERLVNPAHLWWTTRAALSGELQRKHPFRQDPAGHQRYGLLPNDDGEIEFRRFEKDGALTHVDHLKHPLDPPAGPRIGFRGEPDYRTALETLGESLGLETSE